MIADTQARRKAALEEKDMLLSKQKVRPPPVRTQLTRSSSRKRCLMRSRTSTTSCARWKRRDRLPRPL